MDQHGWHPNYLDCHIKQAWSVSNACNWSVKFYRVTWIACIAGPGKTSWNVSGWQDFKCNHFSRYFTWDDSSRRWGQNECLLHLASEAQDKISWYRKWGAAASSRIFKSFVSVNCSDVYLIPNWLGFCSNSIWSTTPSSSVGLLEFAALKLATQAILVSSEHQETATFILTFSKYVDTLYLTMMQF